MARATRRRAQKGGVRWINVILGSLLTVLMLVVVLGFSLWLWLKSYLRGEEFRDLVSVKTSALFSAEGGFEEIEWTGSSAYSDGYDARGLPGAPFSRVTANGIRAYVDFGAVRDGVWKIDEIDINRLVLLVDARSAGAATESRGLDEVDAESGEEEKVSGIFGRLIPRSIEIGEVEVADTHLKAERARGGVTVLDGSRISLRPLAGSKAWALSGRGGTLAIADAPKLEIDTFTTRWHGRELFITDAAFSFYESAVLTASGGLRFDKDAETNLNLKLSGLDVDHALDPQWKEKISGMLQGDVVLTGKPGDPVGLRKEGTLQLTKGVIEDLPVLDRIADYAKAERFRRLVLHQASADFTTHGEETVVKDIVLQSDGLTRLTGEMVISGERIEGTFRVGVTPGTLKWIPGAEQKVFTEPADGFLWTGMRVTGSRESPTEDLSTRLVRAAVDQIAEDTVNKAADTAEKALEDPVDLLEAAKKAIRENPEEVMETGKKLLESLRPFLK